MKNVSLSKRKDYTEALYLIYEKEPKDWEKNEESFYLYNICTPDEFKKKTCKVLPLKI